MFNNSVIFKIQMWYFGKLIRLSALYVTYQLSQIEDFIQDVPQFPCLLGHPVLR